MHPFVLINLHLSLLTLITATTTITTTTNNITSACYGTTLPSLPSSIASENRSIPWGTPSLHLPNGTTCCSSLTQVRDGIDDIDTQLLELLALRAGYVAEATRCKATLDSVDVPSRDKAVIQEAVDQANTTVPVLPKTVAKEVFEAIINASVPFEKCIFAEFDSCHGG